MKNAKVMALLLIGVIVSVNAYHGDYSSYDTKEAQAKNQAKMTAKQKKLEAKTAKKSAKIKADTQFKKTEIEVDRQKELADIEYKKKVESAEIQADREKARAEGVNVYGNGLFNWRGNVAKTDRALATTDVSLFR